MSISSGSDHTCALRHDGAPVCWGYNGAGQASPPDNERFASISSGSDHTCALRHDGSPVCWGYNWHRQASPPEGERFAVGRVDLIGLTEPGPAVTPAVTPEEARDRAAAALRGLASAHFRMTHEAGASADVGFAALTEMEGGAVFPGRARFTAKANVALFRNATLQFDVVRIGEMVYLRDGVSGQWQTLPAGTLGIDFSNVAGSVADAVDSMRSVELTDGGSVGGADTLRLTGAAEADALHGFAPSAPEGGTLQVTLWAGREDFLIRKVEVIGILFPNDPSNITRMLELSRFDEPVAVEPPV